jgi:hypothetical protein
MNDDAENNLFKENPKLTLKFDIQRPILESILPKYGYLKSLTRARVFNWNQINKYPYFEEFDSKKNLYFQEITNGFNCTLLSSMNAHTPSSTNNSFKYKKTRFNDTANEPNKTSEMKLKANLNLTKNIDVYLTPLSFLSVERFFNPSSTFKKQDDVLQFNASAAVNHKYKPSTQSMSKDCWTYMLSILQLNDFVPEPKYVEKINEINKELKHPRKSYVHVTKNVVDKEQSVVSFFGWVNINQIDSRASLGTVTFDGQMKNIQLSSVFGKKIDDLSDRSINGSLNLRVGATNGKFTQNSG